MEAKSTIESSLLGRGYPGDDDVAHYTRLESLIHFLPPGTSSWSSGWASPVQFLNDRQELVFGLRVLKDVAQKRPMSSVFLRNLLADLERIAGADGPDAFQMSFSGNRDELGQWRGYGDNGFGCAVVVPSAALRSADVIAGWVRYESSGQRAFASKVLRALRNQRDRDVAQKTLVAAASFVKHPGFAVEREFRLVRFAEPDEVFFRGSGQRIVPTIDVLRRNPVTPTKVLLGPAWQLANLTASERARHHVVQGVRRLLDHRSLHHVLLQPSGLPFDPR